MIDALNRSPQPLLSCLVSSKIYFLPHVVVFLIVLELALLIRMNHHRRFRVITSEIGSPAQNVNLSVFAAVELDTGGLNVRFKISNP